MNCKSLCNRIPKSFEGVRDEITDDLSLLAFDLCFPDVSFCPDLPSFSVRGLVHHERVRWSRRAVMSVLQKEMLSSPLCTLPTLKLLDFQELSYGDVGDDDACNADLDS